jgi:hypothetical protein
MLDSNIIFNIAKIEKNVQGHPSIIRIAAKLSCKDKRTTKLFHPTKQKQKLLA